MKNGDTSGESSRPRDHSPDLFSSDEEEVITKNHITPKKGEEICPSQDTYRHKMINGIRTQTKIFDPIKKPYKQFLDTETTTSISNTKGNSSILATTNLNSTFAKLLNNTFDFNTTHNKTLKDRLYECLALVEKEEFKFSEKLEKTKNIFENNEEVNDIKEVSNNYEEKARVLFKNTIKEFINQSELLEVDRCSLNCRKHNFIDSFGFDDTQDSILKEKLGELLQRIEDNDDCCKPNKRNTNNIDGSANGKNDLSQNSSCSILKGNVEELLDNLTLKNTASTNADESESEKCENRVGSTNGDIDYKNGFYCANIEKVQYERREGKEKKEIITNEEEEIPSFTLRTNVTEKLKSDLCSYKYKVKRVVLLFISDLHNCIKDESDKHFFNIFNMKFRKVKLRGTVVATVLKSNFFVVTVDDGTGEIDCFISPQSYIKDFRKEVNERHEKFHSEFKGETSCNVMKSVALMQRLAINCVKSIPTYTELELGDEVEIIGNLSEYIDKRNVFVDLIKKVNSFYYDEDIIHLENLMYLYENVYNVI